MSGLIRNAPFAVFVLMVLFPLAMAGVLAFAGLRARRQVQLVTSTKSVAIGMADDGYRQFEGTAEAIGGQTLRAPLTGSECVWFEARVEEMPASRGRDNSGAGWRTVRSITSSAPLLVRDATGACVVRVQGAEVTPRDKSRWIGASLEPEDRNPARLGVQESPPILEVSTRTNRFRYTETRIYPGDPLTVLGQFARHRFHATADDDDRDVLLDGETAEDLAREDHEDDGEETPDVASAPRGRTANHGWARADAERQDALDALAPSVTKAEIRAGGRGKPLIVAATISSTHAYMSEMGAQAAFMVALVPLAIAALVLYARLG